MTVIQEFEDLPPQQRALAEAMRGNGLLMHAVNTQVGFTLDAVEAGLLFDGSLLLRRDAAPYSRRGLTGVLFVIDLGAG